jgi:nicotinate-nucleotide adenylyltransferase
MQSIGIFGGTFDPPHLRHLILADEARSQLQLDQVLWVLTPDPPHKTGQSITPLEHRLAMLQLAIQGVTPAFYLSKVDIDRRGPHYALDTLRLLAEQYPQAELVYLMGGDSLHDLPSWHRPAEVIANLASIGVMRRPGDSIDLTALEKVLPGLTAKVRFVDAPLLEISAREIRARAARGGPYRYYLPPPVYEYIQEHQLYRAGPA